MSKRAFISIGCNKYDHLPVLDGAELDARRTFDTLISPSAGEFDADFSSLLLSPTTIEVQSAITKVLFSGEQIETFVIFFAGHGATKAGSFYMCCRDARESALSATAFSLADLFLKIGEAKPKQSYIIIDACESGGLIADLGVILKSELLGKAGTPGITLLATSARDQASNENQDGGFGTNALLDCISGRKFVQDLTPTLDLMEIGRVVSDEIAKKGDQTPVVWGLNLYGPPLFCKNPYFHSITSASLRNVTASWPTSVETKLEEHLPVLWDAYLSVDRDWDANLFREKLAPVLTKLASETHAAATFLDRFSNAAAERANQSDDVFRTAEVLGACAAALLPFGSESDFSDNALRSIASRAFTSAERALEVAVSALKKDKYALLARRGGLSDLFYLPVRITKLLGWAGAIVHFKRETGASADATKAAFASLLDSVIEYYSTSITSMSDSQSAPLALALTATKVLNLQEQGEAIASLMFSSFIACRSKVAASGIESQEVLDYLLFRLESNFSLNPSLVAQPSELLTVLLKCSSLFDLVDVFDETLHELDYVHFSSYVPDDFDNFGDERIEGGRNFTYWIGHDIWRVADLENSWPSIASMRPPSVGGYCGALLAALVFPDRVPWFVFPSRELP